MATFRPLPDSKSTLFTVYNDAGDEQLALEVEDRVTFLYQVSSNQLMLNEFLDAIKLTFPCQQNH